MRRRSRKTPTLPVVTMPLPGVLPKIFVAANFLSRENALMLHGAASILEVLRLVLTAQARLDRRSA